MLIQAVKKHHGRIRVIPTNIERYLAISVGKVQFLDSLQFTLKKLDDLVKTLNDEDFKETRKEFPNDREFELMRKKGIFAYDFFDDLSKLNETMLPPQEAFKDTLDDKDCSNDEYKHAELVWKTFQCKTFREYHDLYLKSDVLLLTDFFEKFRETCLESYGLDAAHYYSSPGMAWSAAMKLTDTKLELLDNEEMYTFFERSIRGGISQVSKRHVRANNKFCKTYSYDSKKPTTFLVYLDANNLYGFALSQKLPTGDFIWYPENQFEKWTEKDILDFETDGEFGEILEVDIHIPSKLHDYFNDYPPAPERLEIDDSMWSPFQKECFPDYKKKSTVKLSPNLLDKTKYVVHMRNQQFYIRHGCKVRKFIVCFHLRS